MDQFGPTGKVSRKWVHSRSDRSEFWLNGSRPGIQFKESGILLRIEIQNPSLTDKNWNQVPGIRNPRRGNPESKTVLDLSAKLQLQTHAIAVFYRHSCILFLLPEHYHQHWNERSLMSNISSKPRWLGI